MADKNGANRLYRYFNRGIAASFDKLEGIAALVFTVVAVSSMSFTQLGFWSVGIIGGKPTYLMLVLAPLVVGALLFGPITGTLLGLFVGAVVFAHASLFPLDYYEIYFMTPLNTFVLLTIIGAAAGWLFTSTLRGCSTRATRWLRIVLICLGMSLLASSFVQMSTIIAYGGIEQFDLIREMLLMSVPGFFVQVFVDAAAMAVLCCIVDSIAYGRSNYAEDRRLLSVFRGWMLLVSCIVFMVASGVNFSVATYRANEEAGESMLSEVEYLCKQLDADSTRDVGTLLEGYTIELDGTVAIMDKDGTIIATDDPARMSVGTPFLKEIGYGSYAADASTFFDESINSGGLGSIEVADEDGNSTMAIEYMAVGSYQGGYVVMLRSSEMVHEGRFGVMLSSTTMAFALIVAIAYMASRLLNEVVVRRIDETNGSLVKITQGDLEERVRVHDSKEFSSLSDGINTTVSALKESIAEAEQRNAQELATAKAIQESALPTDFPAFPDIDRFDIYASMKTAKEVGGDFYDFFLVEGTSQVGFVIADVSGKGIPASLFMMTAKTQVQTYMSSGLPIDEAINATNHQLCIGNDAGMFVTMFACLLDYETGVLSYVNAGHNPPLILHDGSWEWMRDVSGMPLGLFDGIPYEPFERQLSAEDMLYLYTDGVTEAMNERGALFGEERLEKTLYQYAEFNPRSVCVGVRRAITDFTKDCEQSDDITMLGLKYGVPPEEKAVMILAATDDQLVHVCNYIHAELHRRRAPKWVYNPLDIASEELFINVCHYAYPDATPEDPGEVRISFEYDPNPPSITVQIIDDGIPYNPLAKKDAVTPDDIADVPIGGLGILMAKRSVDDMAYERIGESNVLTFRKSW